MALGARLGNFECFLGRTDEGVVEGRGDEQPLPCQKVGTPEGAVGLTLHHFLPPEWCGLRARDLGVFPARDVRAGARGSTVGSGRGDRLVEEGAELVRRHSALLAVFRGDRPEREGFVHLAWEGFVIDFDHVRDLAACLVAPDLGSAQRREVLQRDLFVHVSWVPAPFRRRVCPGVEFDLERIERFSARQPKAL